MATRHGWNDLPEAVRGAVQDNIGPVSGGTDLAVGHNNDLAVRLDRADQPPVFCKGVHGGGRRGLFLDNEATTGRWTDGIAPTVLCAIAVDNWQIVGFEFVQGRSASLSPGSTDLDLIAHTVDALSMLPAHTARPLRLRWRSTDWWRKLAMTSPESIRDWHVEEMDRLSTLCPELVDGNQLLHTDLHSDQFLISAAGVRVIDWAFPGAGAAWVDAAFLVIRLIMAGHEVPEAHAWAQGLRCWADASEQAVTSFAAYVAGMWSCWATATPTSGAVERAAAARAYAAWRVGKFAPSS